MEFDYLIAGGGSPGAALAARLSEDPSVTVCLREAGGRGDSILVRAPAAVAEMMPVIGFYDDKPVMRASGLTRANGGFRSFVIAPGNVRTWRPADKAKTAVTVANDPKRTLAEVAGRANRAFKADTLAPIQRQGVTDASDYTTAFTLGNVF